MTFVGDFAFELETLSNYFSPLSKFDSEPSLFYTKFRFFVVGELGLLDKGPEAAILISGSCFFFFKLPVRSVFSFKFDEEGKRSFLLFEK